MDETRGRLPLVHPRPARSIQPTLTPDPPPLPPFLLCLPHPYHLFPPLSITCSSKIQNPYHWTAHCTVGLLEAFHSTQVVAGNFFGTFCLVDWLIFRPRRKFTNDDARLCLLQKHNWKIGFLSLARLSARPLRPPRVCNFIKFRATAPRKFFANVGDINSSSNLGVCRAKSIMGPIANQPLGIPAQQIQPARPQQIQLAQICNKSNPPVWDTALQLPPCHYFAREALLLGVRGVEWGCKQWRLILPLTFYPSPAEGDWTALTVLQPFQFCK